MKMKTILVPLRSTATAKIVLPPAVALARRHDAHVIGLHVIQALDEIVYPGVDAMTDLGRISEVQREHGQEIRTNFENLVATEDIAGEFRLIETHSSTAADRIAEHARAADLIIVSQANPDHDTDNAPYWVERVIRKCGRPVLVIPYIGAHGSFGAKTLIGWSSTREAARAAHDALPLLREDGKAIIVTSHGVREDGRLAVETAKEMALCYDRHGVKVEVVERVNDVLPVAELLLNESSERGADLIVTGAFGHSRVYDFVIGATTTRLLQSMTVPVLFSS